MSDKDSKDLEEAVRKYCQAELPGSVMTDFYIIIAAVPDSPEPSTQYLFDASDSPIHSLMGLARMGFKHMEEEDND